jgi:hypothetical protein
LFGPVDTSLENVWTEIRNEYVKSETKQRPESKIAKNPNGGWLFPVTV